MVRSVVSRRNPMLMSRLERILAGSGGDADLERAMDESYNHMMRELYGVRHQLLRSSFVLFVFVGVCFIFVYSVRPRLQDGNSEDGDAEDAAVASGARSNNTRPTRQARKAATVTSSPAPPPEEPDEYDTEVPHHFLCPITRELMDDPVLAPDGHTCSS